MPGDAYTRLLARRSELRVEPVVPIHTLKDDDDYDTPYVPPAPVRTRGGRHPCYCACNCQAVVTPTTQFDPAFCRSCSYVMWGADADVLRDHVTPRKKA